MAKVSNQNIYNQDDNLSMEDYLLGTNNNTINKKTQTYSLGSIFSLFYNFLGYNAFLFTTDTDTYPIASPGCFFAFDEHNQITSNFQQARKLTFSSNDTYNFNVTEYLQMLVDSDKFLFKLINLEDKNNFIFLKPRNFTLSNTLTSFDVNIEIQYGLSNGNFVNYKKYLLLLEFDAVNNSHTHSNKSILDSITEPFTTSLKSLYDGAVTNIDNLLLTGQRLITSGEITKLSNTSGTNTGDETTLSIQTKRPLKTVNNESLEGSGNVDVAILESIDLHKNENYTINYNLSDGSVIPLELSQSHRHIQTTNSNKWLINHNLGYKPSVTLVDIDGTEIHGDIEYNTNNELTVTFSEQVKGEAYLN